MKDQAPLVSILTLNYNQTEATCAFLESCRHLTYPNYEILVCDMASKENPESAIKKVAHPKASVFLSNANLGFAGGNNWGMERARGEYILIINNDTEVTGNLIEQLLLPFQNDESAAIVCPKIKYFDHPEIIQYAGFKPMNPITGRTWSIGHLEADKGQYDELRATWGAHGAAMMVKKEVTRMLGRFPEKFFLYYEEWDWSARILKAGYKIYYQGYATIYHKESMSVGKRNPLKEFYLTRNRILYMRRNSSPLQLTAFLLFFSLFTFPKTILKYLINKNFIFLKAFLKGIWSNMTMSAYSPV